eukprot:TRINITY_DN11797_c0_g2_i1.p1 TRINITY_DN11797_c0_g2~~TRINITY_DN11797_c0_g2_i1.p1  ORF type:complete len:213 (-),score=43.18 TRINITY_DN11797_c0_g2_i1:194-832(-)
MITSFFFISRNKLRFYRGKDIMVPNAFDDIFITLGGPNVTPYKFTLHPQINKVTFHPEKNQMVELTIATQPKFFYTIPFWSITQVGDRRSPNFKKSSQDQHYVHITIAYKPSVQNTARVKLQNKKRKNKSSSDESQELACKKRASVAMDLSWDLPQQGLLNQMQGMVYLQQQQRASLIPSGDDSGGQSFYQQGQGMYQQLEGKLPQAALCLL